MRKLMPLLALVLLLAGCTGGCGQTAPVESGTPEASPTPLSSRAPAGSPAQETEAVSATPDVQPTPAVPSQSPAAETPGAEITDTPAPEETPSGDTPDDEAVLAAYRQAVEAFWWFQVETMPFDLEAPQTVDGEIYYPVDYPGIATLSDLRGYLKSLFSDQLVEELLPYDGTQYIEVDGRLCVRDGARGTDITRGAETVQVVRDGNPDRCVVLVTVEVLDPEQDFAVTGSVSYEFPYERVGETWIFTDFCLVR